MDVQTSWITAFLPAFCYFGTVIIVNKYPTHKVKQVTVHCQKVKEGCHLPGSL